MEEGDKDSYMRWSFNPFILFFTNIFLFTDIFLICDRAYIFWYLFFIAYTKFYSIALRKKHQKKFNELLPILSITISSSGFLAVIAKPIGDIESFDCRLKGVKRMEINLANLLNVKLTNTKELVLSLFLLFLIIKLLSVLRLDSRRDR